MRRNLHPLSLGCLVLWYVARVGAYVSERRAERWERIARRDGEHAREFANDCANGRLRPRA